MCRHDIAQMLGRCRARRFSYPCVMIDAVLFDLDETLLDRTTSLRAFLADQFGRHAGSLGNVGMEQWREHFLALDRRGQVLKTIVYPAILAEFGGEAGAYQTLFADYASRCSAFAVPFDAMMSTLIAIRSMGLPIAIVTNGGTEFQTKTIEALDLHKLTDAIFISEREGLRKPDPEIYRRAMADLGTDPASTAFIDNKLPNVEAAAALGIATHHFTGADGLRAFLQELAA